MSINSIKARWERGFRDSFLFDTHQTFQLELARILFYGGENPEYPSNIPKNFSAFNRSPSRDREEVLNTILAFFNCIGIELTRSTFENHLQLRPNDLSVLCRKAFFIFRFIGQNGLRIQRDAPFNHMSGDIWMLLKIESGQSTINGQLDLFPDVEIPELHSGISIPKKYGEDPEIASLFNKIEQEKRSIFITGKAGTGKSTFIHYFMSTTTRISAAIAFTGIAALNIGGQTIHSFFQFVPGCLLPNDNDVTIFSESHVKRHLIEKLEVLIIDEVSMLRSDLLEAIDYSLRMNSRLPDMPFGGKQIIFVGDVYQLPPVVDLNQDGERFLFMEYFNSEYFFDSNAYKLLNPDFHELSKSHRQSSDPQFVKLLDNVRQSLVDDETIRPLNAQHGVARDNEDFVMTLTTTNKSANKTNFEKLNRIPYPLIEIHAQVKGEFHHSKYPTSRNLKLKKDAQVVILKNDPSRRWVNGTLAKVFEIKNDHIEIMLANGTIYRLEQEIWENRRYKYDRDKKRMVSSVVGTFQQYPVKLAWAITIHKSQGLTFDQINIDLEGGTFVNGQLYTALSRCRSLEGIRLTRPIRQEDVIQDNRLTTFMKSLNSSS